MKCLIALLIVCYVIRASEAMTKEEMVAAFKKIASDCAQNEGATDQDMDEIFARKVPSTREGKCVHACLGEMIGVMKNNMLDVERAVELAEMAFNGDTTKVNTARELANECSGVTDGDRCDAAVKLFECGHMAIKSRGITFENM
ncbi:general odorant-binding protein 19d-like [Contarinia nasturtii]|uniref:general odorant-binding protein 19d-like n=1 Tax=Contarinia nasturtii TaxID=265458 RepID=UPI0012D4ABA2|nr:general odorant-binding protein 19d-like [Contarinia nasturtii]